MCWPQSDTSDSGLALTVSARCEKPLGTGRGDVVERGKKKAR